ncbi:MAG: NAD(P)-dependent oxidoreductase [Deltaproteobacteria bacterium]|nr:MAG: NAD(P)-dependent oxidoreductase [Deltaproteobacteria bacterium]
MRSLAGKTLFITGASRGIGKAVALRAATDGARIAIAAKTEHPHPKLPGTIYTAAEEIRAAGGEALPLVVDVRSEEMVAAAIEKTVTHFGGIDILVNNASAISLTSTEATGMKRFDLMHQINTRGTFLCTKLAIPHLRKAENPHVLNMSPPLRMEPRWFAPHVAYTMAKYGMSMCVLGMAEEFREEGIAFNALWPRTTIATAAVRNLLGGEEMIQRSRKPEIVADAAWFILTRKSRECTGNFFIDEEVLTQEGITDFRNYQVDPNLPPSELMIDFYV